MLATRKFNKLIILDLDETLLFSSDVGLECPADFIVGHYQSYIRPFTPEFINFCFTNFEHVAVWTSATSDYAEEVCRELFKAYYGDLAFIWSRQRCVRYFNAEYYEVEWIKDLNKVKRRGYALEKVIMVDNTPKKLRRHYGNLVKVRDYIGEADNELELLMAYLPILAAEPNVRVIEKRGWRNITNG